MIELIWKETGEKFILPTPSGGQTKIDELTKNEFVEDPEMDKKWFEFHKNKRRRK